MADAASQSTLRRARCLLRRIVLPMIWALAGGLPAVTSSAENEPAPRHSSDDSPVHVVPAGVHTCAFERWGQLGLSFSNRDDEPAVVLAATFFVEAPGLQYARRIKLPPRSRLRVSQPVLLPPPSADVERVDFRTLVLLCDERGETLLRDNVSRLQLEGVLKIAAPPLTGVVDRVVPPRDPQLGIPRPVASDLAMACRVSQRLHPSLSQLGHRSFVASPEVLAPLDQLVIADDDLLADAASLAAVRDWLFSGGMLWVMLDAVDNRLVEALLGDEFACSVVDRARLTTINLLPGPGGDPGASFASSFSDPVDLLRVAVSDVDVAYVIDDWPAAFWKECGEGRLLVTTLGSAAWMRLRQAGDPPSHVERHLETPYIPIDPMRSLASEFFRRQSAQSLPASALAAHVRDYIGYALPPRRLVTGLLAGFSVLLACAGGWLWHAGRLERLGFIGPALALCCSAALVMAGRQSRESLAPTVAMLQFVQPIAGTDDVRVTGAAALYAAESGTVQLTGERGGWLLPDLDDTTGTTQRLVWTDLDRWKWENVPQIPGLRNATFAASHTSDPRCEANASFDSAGLSGRLSVPRGLQPADAVLVTRDGRIGVSLHENGNFIAAASHGLGPGQFLDSEFLTDEQVRRSRVLARLLDGEHPRDFPHAPTVFFWTQPWNLGFRFADGTREIGSALVAAPLRLTRPAAGANVTIPAALLPYRETPGPDGLQPSGLYNYRTRVWQAKAGPSATWLRFQLPAVLLPFESQAASLTVEVSGPAGNLEVAAVKAGEVVPVKSWSDPIGRLTLELSDPQMLQVDTDGTLWLRISGGDAELTRPQSSVNNTSWRIETLAFELRGKVVETAVADNGR